MKVNKKINLIKQRDKIKASILEYLKTHKLKPIEGRKTILYSGELSPGCRLCVDGSLVGIFMTMSCTKKCFFCPQNRELAYDILPSLQDGVTFYTPDNFADYLKKFNFKGVGFSGGDALYVFDRLIKYMAAVSKKFGKKIHMMLNTNGDLITEGRLIELRQAGLDEIRFDLAAREYDFAPVKLARKYIKTITIETPVIPEDYSILIKSLDTMQKIGVDYLATHTLKVNRFNKAVFEKRGYIFDGDFSLGNNLDSAHVIDSEIASLNLFQYMTNHNIQVKTNYCSFQTIPANKIYSNKIKEPYESVTPLGLIKSLEIEKPNSKLINYLQKKKDHNKWKLKKASLYISLAMIKDVIPFLQKNGKLYINYYLARISNLEKKTNNQLNIKVNNKFSVNISKVDYLRIALVGIDNMRLYDLMFNQKQPLNNIIKKITIRDLNSYSQRLEKLFDFYYKFKDLEFFNKDLV